MLNNAKNIKIIDKTWIYILNILFKIPFVYCDCAEVVNHKVDNDKAMFVPENKVGCPIHSFQFEQGQKRVCGVF